MFDLAGSDRVNGAGTKHKLERFIERLLNMEAEKEVERKTQRESFMLIKKDCLIKRNSNL